MNSQEKQEMGLSSRLSSSHVTWASHDSGRLITSERVYLYSVEKAEKQKREKNEADCKSEFTFGHRSKIAIRESCTVLTSRAHFPSRPTCL